MTAKNYTQITAGSTARRSKRQPLTRDERIIMTSQDTTIIDQNVPAAPAETAAAFAQEPVVQAAQPAAPAAAPQQPAPAAPQPVQQQPYGKENAFAVTSFVLGIASIVSGWTFIAPIIGLVFGVLALRRNTSERMLALWGVWLNVAMLALSVLLVLFFIVVVGIALIAGAPIFV